jgi:hypothetical protein
MTQHGLIYSLWNSLNKKPNISDTRENFDVKFPCGVIFLVTTEGWKRIIPKHVFFLNYPSVCYYRVANLPPVSFTPGANLPPVSVTPGANLHAVSSTQRYCWQNLPPVLLTLAVNLDLQISIQIFEKNPKVIFKGLGKDYS